jgi:hypothetical protein
LLVDSRDANPEYGSVSAGFFNATAIIVAPAERCCWAYDVMSISYHRDVVPDTTTEPTDVVPAAGLLFHVSDVSAQLVLATG